MSNARKTGMMKHVLMHKATGRYAGPKSKLRYWESLPLDKLTVDDLEKARIFSSLSAAHNTRLITKDVDYPIFDKNRIHTGDKFEYVAIPVQTVLLIT